MSSPIPARADAGLLARAWLPVAAYVLLIFVVSSQPYLQPPVHFHNADKLMHLGEYGLFGLLLERAVRMSLPGHGVVTGSLLAIAMGMTVGALDERFQSIIPGRQCSLFDWFADSAGVALAQVLSALFAGQRRT